MEVCDLRSDCPINYVIELLGDKWSLLIIRDIIFEGKSSYNEFLASREKIATNMLASRLVSLEENGFIKKVPKSTSKARHTYMLTPMAIDLIPLFVEMILWSAKYTPLAVPQNRRADLQKAQADRKAYAEEIRQRVLQRSAAVAGLSPAV